MRDRERTTRTNQRCDGRVGCDVMDGWMGLMGRGEREREREVNDDGGGWPWRK